MRLTRWILIAASAGAVALAGVVLAASPEALSRRLGARIAAATGGEVAIGDPVTLDLLPRPVLRVADVGVTRDGGALLTARRVVVPVGPGILAGGLPARIEAEGAALRIAPGAVPAAGDLPDLSLRDSEVTLVTDAAPVTLRAVDLDVTSGARGLGLSGSALLNGRTLSGTATLTDAATLLSGGIAPIEAELRLAATTLTLEGRADLDPPSFDGRAALASTDALAAVGALGLPRSRLPEGFGARRIEASAALTLAPGGGVHLRDAVATLDGNRLSGEADIVAGDAGPRVTARLSAEALDLSAFGPAANGGETLLVSETGWSRRSIPAGPLAEIDADIALSSGPVTLGAARLDALEAGLTGESGRWVLTLAPARGWGGEVSGEVVLNGRDGLSARATLDFAGLAAAPVSTALTGHAPFAGTISGRIDVLGSGDSMAAMMASIGGEAALRLDDGRIEGADLAALAQGGGPDGATPVARGAVTLSAADGVARGGDLAIKAPELSVAGEGTLDLAAQLLDWRLRVASAEAGAEVAVSGPWADPELRAVASRPTAPAPAQPPPPSGDPAPRENDPLAPVRERAARELGVAPEVLTDRDAVEDAIRRRVGREILDLLRDR